MKSKEKDDWLRSAVEGDKLKDWRRESKDTVKRTKAERWSCPILLSFLRNVLSGAKKNVLKPDCNDYWLWCCIKKHYLIVQKQQALLISYKHLFFFPPTVSLWSSLPAVWFTVCVCVCVRTGVIRSPEHLPAAGQEVSNRLINTESGKKKRLQQLLQDVKLCSYFVSSD